VNDFLLKMIDKGITRISGITLLYEETEKRLLTAEREKVTTYAKLENVSMRNLKLRDVRVIRLPSMRVLTSYTKESNNTASDDIEHAYAQFESFNIRPTPGLRDCFYIRKPNDLWVLIAKISDDFNNDTPYCDSVFEGGLFALASSYMEEMDTVSGLLKTWLNESPTYKIDTDECGNWRCHEMIEEILPLDISRKLKRYQQDIFIPIKLRPEIIEGGNQDGRTAGNT